MALTMMGKKRGMIQLFDEKGNVVVCTVIQAEPNVVTQIKNEETDGYVALQLGFDKVTGKTQQTIEARTKKPQLGHFKKAGVESRRFLVESRLDSTEGYALGQEIGVDLFNDIEFVDATAISKGKGYQGVMKRHNFRGMPASHGTGPTHRHAGSTGMRSTPGRALPGGKKAGQMGNERITVQNLRVVKVDPENHVIVVKGQVPGPRNGLVYITQAKKKMPKKSHK
ncbi:50S ribosomal protein L3 [Candidatus Protochlamydia phocaeensis]|uniref:50S ribosomal protein L3 n=1 Tax=Candidatus Protochlamydia phocaeensis TaxID=1414722 RepID=UPI000838FBA8|nr:50S ribosomal protein L3 [Candidatus Protochlamydia phocaeensis]